jgi:hypothetical protein
MKAIEIVNDLKESALNELGSLESPSLRNFTELGAEPLVDVLPRRCTDRKENERTPRITGYRLWRLRTDAGASDAQDSGTSTITAPETWLTTHSCSVQEQNARVALH